MAAPPGTPTEYWLPQAADMTFSSGVIIATWTGKVAGKVLSPTGTVTFDSVDKRVDFAGSGEYLSTTTTFGSISQPFTIAFVVKYVTHSNFSDDISAGAGAVRFYHNAGATAGVLYATNFGTVTFGAQNQVRRYVAVYNGASCEVYEDGATLSTTADAGTNAFAGTMYVHGNHSGGAFSVAEIGPIVIYSGDQSASLAEIDDWLNGGWEVSAPVAAFSGTPLSGTDPLSVVFTDASTNTPTSWLWEKNSGSGYVNFDSGATSQNPTESFTEGTWDVKLTATNAGGSDAEEKLDYVTSSAAAAPAGSGGAVAANSGGARILGGMNAKTKKDWKKLRRNSLFFDD
jgi:PKD repeat protein